MRTSSVLLSAFHFILSTFLLMVGILFLGLGKISHVKLALWRYLDANPDIFSIVGISLIALGAVLFMVMFTVYKKVFYQVKMNSNQIQIDPEIIESYVKHCMKEILPGIAPNCEVIIGRNQKIEIFTKLGLKSVEEHETALAQLEKRISNLLKEKMGYRDEFLLTVTVE